MTEEWTLATLKEYLEMRLEEADRRAEQRYTLARGTIEAAQASAKEAVEKAESANERRFESVNEFRRTLSDQTASFITRDTYDVQHRALEITVDLLRERVDRAEGRTLGERRTSSQAWAYILAVAGLALSAAIIFTSLHH